MWRKDIFVLILGFLIINNVSPQSLLITEFQAINNSTIADEYGEYNDWIELYNNTSEAIDLNGYYMTDSIGAPTKFQFLATEGELVIEPDSFIVLWADNEVEQGKSHLGFKLSGSGEEIGLYSPTIELIDNITFGQQYVDISFGRNPGNISQWVYFSILTPGKINSNQFDYGIVKPPVFNIPGGFYNSTQSITINHDNIGDIVYYSLNNSLPDELSDIYTGPISISNTEVVRAISYHDGYLPSTVKSNIYIMNESFALPVLAIIMDSLDLYGSKGIYSNPWNEGIEWERFCQLQYFIDGKLDMQANSGIRIQGGNSVGMAKKSFRLFFRSDYGNGKLEYPLFGPNTVSSFENIVVKAGYDDDITTSTGTLLRDVLSVDLWNKTGGLSTNSNWAMLYLMDKFWGLYNLRESVNEHFVMSHTGLTDFDFIRFGRTGPDVKYGTIDEWSKLENLVNSLDFTTDEAFYSISQEVDMEYLINFTAFMHCSQYRGWTWNASAYKDRSPDGRWRWLIWDTDRSFTSRSWNGFNEAQSTWAEKWTNFILKALYQNDIFNQKLIARISDLLNTTFLPDNAIEVLDSLYTIVNLEMHREIARWKPSNTYWNDNVENVRVFLRDRPDYLKNQLIDRFELGNEYKISLAVEGKGNIQISTLKINQFPWEGYYFEDYPVELTAQANPGYKFKGWEGIDSSDINIEINLEADSEVKAVFEIDSSYIDSAAIIINEICYLPDPSKYTNDWIELYNPYPFDVDISGWILKDNNEAHYFTFPDYTTIKGGDYIIVANNSDAFKYYFPETNNITGSFGLGDNGFGLSNNADAVRLYNDSNYLVDSVSYLNSYPWPLVSDIYGGSIQLIFSSEDNSNPDNWAYSSNIRYTPGYKNDVSTSLNLVNTELIGDSYQFICFPNPFTDIVIIETSIPFGQNMNMTIYNNSMQVIDILYDGYIEKGEYEFKWDGNTKYGKRLSPGLYICTLRTENSIISKKILYMPQ